jgi:ABC-type multidrug transport system fused ATPase/permease subunit
MKKLITLGDLINVTILANMFFVSLPVLLMSSINIKSTENLWNKIYKKFDKGIEKTFKKNEDMQTLEIRDLCVNYDNKIIFKNFTYTIHKGDKICIVGKNGSGKSTLITCLCQLNEYTGSILYNHSNIEEIDIFKHISYISQKPFIFADSLNFNIFLSQEKGNIDMVFFEKLLEILELSTLFNERANQTITLNDENISGGEKQKIALLRMLLTNPEIIILDEALSMVDTSSRYRILEFLIKQEYTIIYVTHNLNEVSLYDNVIDFDNLN